MNTMLQGVYMALVSKAKAAKLAGVSRTTIHRYVTDGKLSMSGDKVDTSELLRVFGSISDSKSEQPGTPVTMNTSGQPVTSGVQGVLQQQITLLEAQVNDLRSDRDNWRQKSDELVELLRSEQENTKLLTHHAPASSKAESFALVVAVAFAVFIMVFLIWQTTR
jgi:DNA-binding transcriptional MerR regulator